MKEKLLKIFIYVSGIICLYAFVTIRFRPLFNSVVTEKLIPGYWDNTKYGELYYFNYITHFKEEGMPPVIEKFQYSDNQADINETEIFNVGDSYFDIARGTQYSKRLMEKTGRKVHYVYEDYPLNYLIRNNYTSEQPSLMILEFVERYIPFKFTTPHSMDYFPEKKKSKLRQFGSEIKELIFYQKSEELYDVLLKRSYLTNWIYPTISTLRFDLFKQVSRLTPAYSLDHEIPWLFYHDQVNDENTSFYYKHTDEEIENICNNIKDLEKKLMDNFNIRLVFLPVPAKYTLYHRVIDNNDDEYNNFLPRLFKGLEERDIPYINIYDDYTASNDILYYGTDSHWNLKGLEIAVEETMNYLSNDSVLSKYIQ